MKAISFNTLSSMLAGFAAGLVMANLLSALTASDVALEELSTKSFDVAIFDVKQNLTPEKFLVEEFSGSYMQTVTVSEGKQHTNELSPVMHKGRRVVRLQDSGHISYMGLSGTTLDGTLLVQSRAKQAAKAT